MSTNERAIAYTGLLMSSLLAGCATPKDVVLSEHNVIKEVGTGTASVLTAVDKHDKGDHAGVTKVAKDYASDLEALRKQLDEQAEKMRQSAFSIDRLSGWIEAGVGTIGQIAAGNYGGAIQTAASKVKEESQSRSAALAEREETRSLIDERHRKVIEAANALSAKVDDQVREVKDDLKESEERVRATVDSLSRDALDKIAKMEPEKIRQWITESAQTPEEVRKQILESLAAQGVSKEDLKKVEGLSTEELIALLISAGVGVTGGGAISRLGKSREHDKLTEHASRLSKIEERRV
ncbi:MAG: hypothetical protein ACKVW3_17665 [Phycisphaerales bacterium]